MKPVPGEEPWQRELEEMYEAFAGARKPSLRSCGPRGYDAEWIGRQPLRELAPELVNDFAFELGLSIGDAEDVRYFLPRLFELMAQGKLSSLYSPALLAQKLAMASWKTWSTREQEAVRKFLVTWFDCLLSRRNAPEMLALVTDFGTVFDDLSPLLARVREREDVAGVFALLWLAESEGERWLKSKRQRHRDDQGQLRRWLQDSASFAQVEALRKRVGLVAPDGEDLRWLFEQVTYWLYVCGAEPIDGM